MCQDLARCVPVYRKARGCQRNEGMAHQGKEGLTPLRTVMRFRSRGNEGRGQATVAAFLSGSRSFSETFNWPRPMPTSMSGLVTP